METNRKPTGSTERGSRPFMLHYQMTTSAVLSENTHAHKLTYMHSHRHAHTCTLLFLLLMNTISSTFPTPTTHPQFSSHHTLDEEKEGWVGQGGGCAVNGFSAIFNCEIQSEMELLCDRRLRVRRGEEEGIRGVGKCVCVCVREG